MVMIVLLLLGGVMSRSIAVFGQVSIKDGEYVNGLRTFLISQSQIQVTIELLAYEFLVDYDFSDFTHPLEWVIDKSTSIEAHKSLTKATQGSLDIYEAQYLIPNSASATLYEHPNTAWIEQANQLNLFFGWDEALLIASEETAIWIGSLDGNIKRMTVSQSSGDQEIDLFTTREIRASGVHTIFLMAGQALNDRLLKAMSKFEMDAGYAIIVIGSHCLFDVSLYPTGVLCTTLKGSEAVTNKIEAEYWYILYFLEKKALETWSIVNVVEGKRLIVGTISPQGIELSNLVIFPRGLTTAHKAEPFKILIGLNNFDENQGFNTQRSFDLALQDNPLLTRKFIIFPIQLPFCGIYEEQTGYLNCYIASKSQKVSVLLSTDITIVVAYQAEFMRQTMLRLPLINSKFLAEQLSSSVLYPFFTRLCQSVEYYTVHAVLFMKKFKWFSGISFAESIFGMQAIENMYSTVVGAGIILKTDCHKLEIDGDDPLDIKSAAKCVKDSNLRPVTAFLTIPLFIQLLIDFYELGLRAKDVILISILIPFNQIEASAKPEEKAAVEEFRSSFIVGMFTIFIGPIGESVKQRAIEAYTTSEDEDCLTYDSLTQAILASEFAIRRGLNFYEWQDMSFAIRSVRFVGCSGTIQQSFEHNNRKDSMVTFMQSQKQGNEFKNVNCLTISVSGPQTYFEHENFIWFDGTSNTPNTHRFTYNNCPFPEEYRIDSKKGKLNSLILHYSLTAIAWASAFVSFGLFFKKSKFKLTSIPIVIGTQDMLLLFSIVIDPCCALLSMPGNWKALLRLFNVQGLDFSQGAYFTVLDFAIGLWGLFVCSVFAVVFAKFKPFRFDIQLLASVILHIIPFSLMTVFAKTFDCSEAQAESNPILNDSFMDIDCFENCWEGRHLIYSVTSFCLLLVFLVFAVTIGPLLLNQLDGLQLIINPRYLLVRYPTLMTLLTISKSSGIGNSVGFLVVLFTYTVFCCRIKMFDISRFNILHNAFLSVVFLSSLMQIALTSLSRNSLQYISIAGIVTIIALTAIIWKRAPNMLISVLKYPPTELFSFAFRLS